jgi:Protein of unknown function (DUF3052)
MMAGYSGTPLPRKLGIQPKFRVLLEAMPADVRADLKDSLSACELVRQARGPLDFVMLFVKSQADLQDRLSTVARQLAPAGMLWVSWPKKTSGVACDMNENDIRRIGLAAGLVDIKVCAVNDTWSGLKFVIPVARRKMKS